MSNERTPYLQELISLSSEATLLMPKIVLDEKYDNRGKYEPVRKALEYLKNDENLFVKEKNVDDDFTLIKIGVREVKNE